MQCLTCELKGLLDRYQIRSGKRDLLSVSGDLIGGPLQTDPSPPLAPSPSWWQPSAGESETPSGGGKLVGSVAHRATTAELMDLWHARHSALRVIGKICAQLKSRNKSVSLT